jgi:molybdopterin-biosynthesis enzyme MoeA-like protein
MTAANSPASKEMVTAPLLVIGGKILSGRTKDRNIGYIAEYLTAVGIDLKEVRVLGDEEAAIVDALNALRHRYTYVFTTGGIGPTHDDITADCVAKAFGVSIDVDPRARHPARMGEDDRRRDERGAPAHDAHPQGRGSHPQQGVGGAWLLDRQCNRDGGRALDHAGDAR